MAQSEQVKKRSALIGKWRRFLGLCNNCGLEARGNKYCEGCRKKGAMWYKKAQARKKRKIQKRREMGLCTNCGAQAKGKLLCDGCREKKSEHQRAVRLKRKKKGLCQECGKIEANKGQYRCDNCLEKMRVRPGNPKKAPTKLPLVSMNEMIKRGVIKVCRADGCNNITLRCNSYCDRHKKIRARPKSKIYFIKCFDCETIFIQAFPKIKHQRCEQCERFARINRSEMRRAKKLNQYVERVELTILFFRDDGRCQLCGRKLNFKRKHPHPWSISIDHIVPISKGGEHSYKNTQLVCLKCNMKKGNRCWPGGEQLRMFG